ncbi:accessory gland-specific peptide 26Ab-like [Drosophila madeirensis]|uniref:Accessory gland-specific peptide 26Ab-like n=1 Tax=Drosophila madeirensis TaxID=30013 RepID=A0AAU9FD10_DROMD
MNSILWLLFGCTICLCRLCIAEPRISALSVAISKQMIVSKVEGNVESVYQQITSARKTKRQPGKMSKRAAARMKYKMDTGVPR